MRGRDMPVTPLPVAALADAVDRLDLAALADCLADDAVLDVPPLHSRARGREAAVDAVAGLFGAFPDLRYSLRQRYQAPGRVTDEAVFTGTQVGPFLGADATGVPGTVAVRVQVVHDEQLVTGITVWPDLGALRRLSGEVARTIDLTTKASSSAPMMISALRAGIPSSGTSKVIQGTLREADGEPTPALVPAPLPSPKPAPGRSGAGAAGRSGGPRIPLPRRVRRRRAVAAGAAMLLVSATLVGWVARGALEKRTGDVVALQVARPTPAIRTPTARPSVRPAPTPGSISRVKVDRTRDGATTLTLPNSVLFEVDSAQLRASGSRSLDDLVREVLIRRPTGTVLVTGYTDSDGSAAHNRTLSLNRARFVAQTLRELPELKGVRFKPLGKGESLPDDGTEESKQANRKVVVTIVAARN